VEDLVVVVVVDGALVVVVVGLVVVVVVVVCLGTSAERFLCAPFYIGQLAYILPYWLSLPQ
jgi:hypothetical protein